MIYKPSELKLLGLWCQTLVSRQCHESNTTSDKLLLMSTSQCHAQDLCRVLQLHMFFHTNSC